MKVMRATGNARLLSYVINYRPHPAFDGPYAIAVVELEEGVKMMANILNVAQTPEALILDMPLKVAFRPIRGDIVIPYFEPNGETS